MITDWARAWSRGLVEPLAELAGRLGLTPNGLTVLGAGAHLIVAYFLARGDFLLGAVALALAASMDGLDGTLARMTGRAGPVGAFLDSVFDRVSEVFLFGGLLLYAVDQNRDLTAMLVLAALAGSILVSYTRARSEGVGLDTKAGFLGRLERMAILVVGLALGIVDPTLAVVAIGAWITAGLRVLDVMRQGTR